MDIHGYANPDSLVSIKWLLKHLDDPSVRIVEVVWGKGEYEAGHIPGALAWEFVDDLGATTTRPDLASQQEIESLLSRSGIAADTTVVVYSGLSNLLATFAFWVLKLYAHPDVRLLDGGRARWLDQEEYPLTSELPAFAPTDYKARPLEWKFRANKDMVLQAIRNGNALILDTRPDDMYRGLDNAGTARGGHIPGAINIPATRETHEDGSFKRWASAYTAEDGTFRSRHQLQELVNEKKIVPEKEILTYCVLGGLSTQAWFALTQLLGYPDVREYERSWQEWGDHAELPIET